MKVCKSCNLVKEYSFFSKSKTNKDGFNNSCKKCISDKYKKKYYKKYYLLNKDNKSKYGIEWRIKNDLYHKQYFQNNKNSIRNYYIIYNSDKKEDIREYQKIYHKNNKDILNIF